RRANEPGPPRPFLGTLLLSSNSPPPLRLFQKRRQWLWPDAIAKALRSQLVRFDRPSTGMPPQQKRLPATLLPPTSTRVCGSQSRPETQTRTMTCRLHQNSYLARKVVTLPGKRKCEMEVRNGSDCLR